MTTRWKFISRRSDRRMARTETTGVHPGVHHGGDLASAKRRFHLPDADWLDLSTGINPVSYPFTPPSEAAWARLPDSAVDERLRKAAAACYGAPSADCVVPAPGSQALIQLLPHLRDRSNVAVLGPTYGEHQARWVACGHAVTVVESPDSLSERFDVVVVGNPNNPDGRIIARARLIELSRALAARGGWLVVDEAFADLDPALSLAPDVSDSGLIVLRSFGKFFGLAGLRLGFALAALALAARIADGLGPWAVSGPAAEIGAAALADSTWIAETRAGLAARAARLDASFGRAGLNVVGGTALFRLVETPNARALHDHLGRHAIHVRDFPDRADRLRFAVPATEAAFARLANALSEPRAA